MRKPSENTEIQKIINEVKNRRRAYSDANDLRPKGLISSEENYSPHRNPNLAGLQFS